MWMKIEDKINVIDKKNTIKDNPSFTGEELILKNLVQEKNRK